VKRGDWIQTDPGKGWFVILRRYSPLVPFFAKAWRPRPLQPAELKDKNARCDPKSRRATLFDFEFARVLSEYPALHFWSVVTLYGALLKVT
jgi:hypothetical protein